MVLQQKNNLFVYIILVFGMFCWGASFVFTAIALKSLDPISIVFVRLLISVVLLWVVNTVFFRKEKISFSVFKWIAALSLFQPFIYFIGETYGLQRISPVVSSLIISTIPVFTAIVMRLFFKAKLTMVNFAGIIISLLGVIMMIVGKNMQIEIDISGLLLLSVAVLAAVVYGILLNKVSTDVHPVKLIAVQNTCAVLYFLPLYLVLGETPNFDHPTVFTSFNPQWEMWICLLILSVFCSTLTFIIYTIAVGRIGIVRTVVFSNLTPIFTAITSFFILEERLAATKIIGIFVVILGLILTQRKKKIIKDSLSHSTI